MKRRVILIVLTVIAMTVFVLAGCTTEKAKPSTKLQVVTTLFPLYDFARTIGGERAEVTMLLPPGMEPHSFEPKPNDIIRVSKAGLFIFTNRYMEPWAGSILKGIERKQLQVVDAGQGIAYMKAAAEDEHDHDHGDHHDDNHAGGMDPHIWLDFGNAALMADNIQAGFAAADPANATYYRANAATLKVRLTELDQRYRAGLQECATRTFLHGGHFTFGYLARRYGLEYRSLSGVSSESEPSAARMAAMVRQIRSSGVQYLFAEELLSPRLSETLAGETGVAVLKLHGAHNLGRDDFQQGTGFIGLMDQNLANLQKGLACRVK
ncbi:MAG: zinc ABC transporter substrate-binding protein [Desulfuromonadales bacterium]|nr:zinc ABC transporter substrate-binding protein [Desulfuromonadales bacterium]